MLINKKYSRPKSSEKNKSQAAKFYLMPDDYMYLTIIKNGMKRIREIRKEHEAKLKEYNELIRENTNLFLRATYVNRGKKVYYYWYRYRWDPVKKRTVHEYVGRRKLNEDEDLPEPPKYPLENLKYDVLDNNRDIVMSRDDYYEYKKFFNGLEVKFNVKELIKSERLPLI
ncbi:MAG: hypothetical protein ACXQS8_04585 [Candidatus Helarchaeales archaeon]